MPTIADYAVFGELVSLSFSPPANVEMPTGLPDGSEERSFGFELPSDLNESSSGILTFLMDTDGADDLHWEVKVNGNRVRKLSHGSDRFCAFQVTVQGAHFQSGMNTVTVRVFSGRGTLNVSEFAFHYQRNI